MSNGPKHLRGGEPWPGRQGVNEGVDGGGRGFLILPLIHNAAPPPEGPMLPQKNNPRAYTREITPSRQASRAGETSMAGEHFHLRR